MYVIAIPSYGRASQCNHKTLTMLSKNNIPKEIIHVYVIEEEFELYQATLESHLYDKLVVGKKGLVPQRQFIQTQYPEGQCIVFLDDDVESVDLSLSTYDSLSAFFTDAFHVTKTNNAYLWGVYPVFNPYFRIPRKPIDTCLNYIVGAFYGIINRTLPSLCLTSALSGQKEDVERSIRYFKEDGIVIRFNKIGFITKYYGNEGGLGTFKERLTLMKEESHKLKELFPLYGDVKTRKNGATEFRLKKLKKSPE